MDVRKELLSLSNYACERLSTRIADMSDEEYMWEPVPDCWTVGQWGLVFDEVPPVTTISWRLVHIIDLLSEERCATWLGLEPEAENLFADGAPRTAQGARDLLEKANARWNRYVTATDDLSPKVGPQGGQYADETRMAFILHIIDELIHHAAEVGVLRDLYRAQRTSDPVVSALLRGESVADVDAARTKHPDLVLTAAALARWDAIPSLIDLGFSIDGRDGRTPLHHAAAEGRIDLIRLLIERGADLEARDPIYKATPVVWAEFFKRTEAADVLREAYKLTTTSS